MTDTQSLLFYIFAFVISAAVLAMGEKRNFKPFIALGLVVPIFIAGFRYDVGTDYGTYLSNIAWLEGVSVSMYIRDFMTHLEPTFYVFTQVAFLFNYPELVLFIYSAISILFFYGALKVSGVRHKPLVYLLFLLVMFPMSFNMVRQFAAISVAVYAVTLLFNHNQKKYYLFTIVASLLHVSALVNVIALVVYRRISRKSKRTVLSSRLFFSLFTIGLVIAITSYGLQKYNYLFEFGSATANLNFIPRVLMLLGVLSLWYTSRLTYRKYKLFIDLGVVGVVLGIAGFFIPYGDRLALYFLPFIIMLLPLSIYHLMPEGKKHLASLAIVSIATVYFIMSYYVMGSHSIIPYRTLLGETL